MRKHFYLLNFLSTVIFGVLIMASCNTATPPEADKVATDTLAKIEEDTVQKSPSKIEGIFHVLWIETATFLAKVPKKRKITFRYYVKDQDSFTLQGWLNRNDDRTFPPDTLSLLVGKVSEYKFGIGSYFSNQVLTKLAIDTIRQTITNTKGKYVVFIPNLGDGNMIEYQIQVTDKDPNSETIPVIKGVDAQKLALQHTNPSPPRGSN